MKYLAKNICKYSTTCWLLIFTVLINTTTQAQDPIFSLQQTSPMNYNPAHVGNTDFTRAIIGYRNQYPAFSNAFTTYSGSFDTYIDAVNSGVGFSIVHDKMAKVFTETSISGAYSYNLRLGYQTFLRAGLQASFRLQSQDPSNLIFPDMIDANGSIIANPFPYNSWNGNSFDVGAGFALMVGPLKVGGAAFNISGKRQQSYGSVKLPNPLRINAYASYDIILVDFSEPDGTTYPIDFGQMSISPSIQYMQQYNYQTISVGAFFKAGTLFVGIHEKQDVKFESFTFTFSTGIEIDRYGFGFSGDIAQLGNPSKAFKTSAFEINLSIKLWQNKGYLSSGKDPRYRSNGLYARPLKGIRIENQGINNKKIRRYKCPY